MMTDFSEKLARLKTVLNITEDQEVASQLGMTKAAFSVRKKRDAFPDEKLYVLAQRRSELALNLDYVLTGRHKPAQEPSAADFSARLTMELERLGMEHGDLLRATGLSVDAVLALAKAVRSPSPAEKNAIFKVPGIDGTFMLTGMRVGRTASDDDDFDLNAEEQRLIETYRRADPRVRAAVTAVLALVGMSNA